MSAEPKVMTDAPGGGPAATDGGPRPFRYDPAEKVLFWSPGDRTIVDRRATDIGIRHTIRTTTIEETPRELRVERDDGGVRLWIVDMPVGGGAGSGHAIVLHPEECRRVAALILAASGVREDGCPEEARENA